MSDKYLIINIIKVRRQYYRAHTGCYFDTDIKTNNINL